MTREDITRMAREANLPPCHTTHPKALERFAKLVAANEREEFKAELVEKAASNTWSLKPTIWVGLDEYTKNIFQDRIKEDGMTDLEIMDLVESYLKVSNGCFGD